jgi:hypothetical protein
MYAVVAVFNSLSVHSDFSNALYKLDLLPLSYSAC